MIFSCTLDSPYHILVKLKQLFSCPEEKRRCPSPKIFSPCECVRPSRDFVVLFSNFPDVSLLNFHLLLSSPFSTPLTALPCTKLVFSFRYAGWHLFVVMTFFSNYPPFHGIVIMILPLPNGNSSFLWFILSFFFPIARNPPNVLSLHWRYLS